MSGDDGRHPDMKTLGLSIAATALSAVALFLPAAPAAAARGSKTCDTALVQSLVDQMEAACPCQGTWDVKRHYKACLRKAQRTIMKDSGNTLRRSCIKSAFRCGSLSTCGEPDGVVACSVPGRGRCLYGLCSDDIGRACTVDSDCVGSCNLADTSADCARAGGVSAAGSCCD